MIQQQMQQQQAPPQLGMGQNHFNPDQLRALPGAGGVLPNDDSIDDGYWKSDYKDIKVLPTRQRVDGKDFATAQELLSQMSRLPKCLGSKMSYLQERTSSYGRFRHLSSYRRCRLINTAVFASEYGMGMQGKWQRSICHTMGDLRR